MSLKKLYEISSQQSRLLDDLAISKGKRFKYRLVAMLLSFTVICIPIILAIRLLVYRELLLILGGALVFFIMIFFWLSDVLSFQFLNHDFYLECQFKASIKLNLMLYLLVGLISYAIFCLIVRLL